MTSSISLSDLEGYLETTVNIAKNAGDMILSAFNMPTSRIHFKQATDLVTETDRNVETFVLTTLKNKYPTHLFIGEEANSSSIYIENIKSVAAGTLTEDVSNEPTWIVDPIDGTTNFVHRFPFSCISIALVINKQVQIGVVFNPMMNEMYTAMRGHGSKLNGESLSVSQTTELKQALVASGFPYERDDKTLDHVLSNIKNTLQNCRAVRRAGSAALDMCYVARGIFDIYYEAGVHAWDIAAGVLIVEEAGGCVSDMYDEEFSLGLRRILCGNKVLVPMFNKILKRP